MHVFPNKKKYIGITCTKPEKRWGKNGNGYKTQFVYRAINKYGWNNIEHKILYKNLTEKEAKQKEITLIEKYNTNDLNKGYNISLGGEGTNGFTLSEETKQKMSESRKGEKSSWYGRHHTEESKKKISDFRKNTHLTKETKQKISNTLRTKYSKIDHPNKGRNHPSIKPIICITTKRFFYTTKEGAKYYNLDPSSLTKCCKGKIKSCGKSPSGLPLKWKYLNYKHNKKYRVTHL